MQPRWWSVSVAIVATGCFGNAKISDQDRTRLNAAIAASEAKANGLVAARVAALQTALASPPTLAGPCTFALPPADALVEPPGGGPPGPDARTAKLHFTLVPSWALSGAERSPSVTELELLWAQMGKQGTNFGQYELSLEYYKDALAHGSFPNGEDVVKLTAELAELSTRSWDWELIVVTDRVTAPQELDNARFAPGEIAGRAFVWSYVDGRIRCSGPVLAHNSDSVMSIKVDRRMTGGKNGFLEGDLKDQAFASAVGGLHEVAR